MQSKRSRTRGTDESGPSEEPPHQPSAQSLTMSRESHPWLNWPGATFNERIGLNNRLAGIQHKVINPPRVMDWAFANRLGISEELDELFMTRARAHNATMEIPIWNRAFNVQEVTYREWCMEFYSSLKVDKDFEAQEILTKEVISFRLGGVVRRVSIPEFGVLLGFFTEEEVENLRMGYYMIRAEFDYTPILDTAHEVWEALSGEEEHTKASKIAHCRFPILRVIHKLLTYSVLHRSSQNDKVYLEDLWLLSLFHKRDPTKYALVPWVVACFMESRGSGRHKLTGQVCCGNFITRIGRSLGLLTEENIELCSAPIKLKKIGPQDFHSSNLLDNTGKRLIAAGPPPTARSEASGSRAQGQAAPRGAQRTMHDEVFRIGQQMDQMNIHLNQLGSYVHYQGERYNPYLEHHAQAWAQSTGATWSPYAPPHMYVDPQYGYNPYPQVPQQQEEEEEEGGDE